MSARLTDYDPHWVLKDGVRIGFVFRSPTKPDYWQTCFPSPPARREQWALVQQAVTVEAGKVQGCRPGAQWAIQGGIESADFATLTVTPSLDGSAGGLWHGFITNGAIVGGL